MRQYEYELICGGWMGGLVCGWVYNPFFVIDAKPQADQCKCKATPIHQKSPTSDQIIHYLLIYSIYG